MTAPANDSAAQPRSERDRVIVFDTTMRDGEQSPGASMSLDEKIELAKILEEMRVDVIEAGFPIASNGDFEAVRAIAELVTESTICGLARAGVADIERCAEAIRPAKRGRIHTFLSTSPSHRDHILHASQEDILEMITKSVTHARNLCDDVEWSAQDATRTEQDFLRRCVDAAIKAGASTINLPDTVGYSYPSEYADIFRDILANVDGAERIVLSTHCHNDLGLAVANSLAGVQGGARQVEVAVNGIGERAGNCSMEEVVMALRTHQSSLGMQSQVNTREIARTSRLVSLLTGYPIQPNKAIVGANAFAHESGIHQHGVLMERTTYEHMDPVELGYAGSRIVLGKHSGRHAVADALRKLGFDLSREELDKAFTRFKELADRKPRITDVDLEALVAGEVLADDAAYRFVGLQVAGGTVMSPTATVRLSHDAGVVEESAIGDGMVDAACAAIAKAVGVDAKLVEFHVSAVSGGTDALGDVTVQVEFEGVRVTGRGVATDVVEASARAYLQAVNKLARSTERKEVPA